MLKRFAQGLGGLILSLIIVGVLFLVAMRTKYPPVLTAVRRFNRDVTKARAMETAGQPGAMAGVIQHVGRNSGVSYETPIGPYPTDDGFVIALPYGSTPDWLKNVLAAGSAVIIHEGSHYEVNRPELVHSDDALPHVPTSQQRSLRWFHVDDFLVVRRVEQTAT